MVRSNAKRISRERIDYLRSLYGAFEKGHNEYKELFLKYNEEAKKLKNAYMRNNINKYDGIKARVTQLTFLMPMDSDENPLSIEVLTERIETSILDLEVELKRLNNELNELKEVIGRRYANNNINMLNNARARIKQFSVLSPNHADGISHNFVYSNDTQESDIYELEAKMENLLNIYKTNEASAKSARATIIKELQNKNITKLNNMREGLKAFTLYYTIESNNYSGLLESESLESINNDLEFYSNKKDEYEAELKNIIKFNNTIALSNMREFVKIML